MQVIQPICLITLSKLFNIQNLLYFSSSTTFPVIFKPAKPASFHHPNPTKLSQLLKQRPTLSQLKQIHSQIITQALSQDTALVGTLIRSYTSSKCISYARILFDHYPSPSPPTLLWNIMIQAYSKIPNSQESLHLFCQMTDAHGPISATPDNYTFTFVITSCSHQISPVYGENIHGQVIKNGYESDIFVGNSMVNLYSVFAKFENAHKFFYDMPQRDVFTWTSLVSGYAKGGEMGRARELFDKMPDRNDVSWAVMIASYVEVGRYTDALVCFNDMLCDDNVKPNEAVLVSVLSACAHLGALDQGKWIHVYIDKIGMPESCNISTALIDMYAKCGRIDCAKQVFYVTSKRDILTYTSMISGLSIHGLGKDAIQIFSQMLAECIKPNDITLLGVLNGCSHSGLVEDGYLIFYNMESMWGVVPKIEHYGCLIDLLGRAGCLERAFEVVRSMPMEPDIVVWRALLSACRIHGDFCLGEQIINHITQLDHGTYGGDHVLLSNLYASLGQWDRVVRVRKLIGESKNSSSPGTSWIEVDGTVHEFRVDDQLHPQIAEIHEKLREVLKRASIEGGYVSNARQVSFDLSEEEEE